MSLPLIIAASERVHRRVAPALHCAHIVHRAVDGPGAMAALGAGAVEIVIIDPALTEALDLLDLANACGAQVIAWTPDADDAMRAAELGQLTCARTDRELIGKVHAAERSLFETRNEYRPEVRRSRTAEAVNRFAQSIATRLNLPDLVRATVVQTRELLSAHGASLLLVDSATGELWFDSIDAGDVAAKLKTVRLKAGQGIAGVVAQTASPVLIADVSRDGRFDRRADAVTGFRTGSIVAVPLVLAGDVEGVLMGVRAEGAAPFDVADLELLLQLAPHVSTAVHNARVTAELQRMQARQMRINEELEQKVEQRSAQISRAKREWEATIDAISEPIALLEDFVIQRANRAYAQKAGIPVQKVVGRKCHELFAGRATPCTSCPLVNGVPTTAPLRAELGISGGDFAFSAFWLSDAPDERRVVVSYKDVTTQRRLEGKLRESERLASIGELASGAAHEINNPVGFVVSNLSSLRGVLEDLREEGGSATLVAEASSMVEDSLAGARRVQDIVRALRQLSKLEVGASEIANVGESARRAARLASVCATFELNATRPAAIAALHLDEALGHVLNNARQAVSGKQRVFVRSFDEEDKVVIEVEDEGCGIPRENLPRIFDPFFTTRGIGKGVGLGLTAAYGIVKRVGGEIEVKSEVGAGSLFRVILPVATQVGAEDGDIGLEVAVALAQEATTAS